MAALADRLDEGAVLVESQPGAAPEVLARANEMRERARQLRERAQAAAGESQAAPLTKFERDQITALLQVNRERNLRAPVVEAAPPAAAPAPVTSGEQQRLEKAALQGVIDARRAEDAPRQVVITRALKNIEDRGGVAAPWEAEVIAEAGLGRPYDRIDPSLARPLSTDERQTHRRRAGHCAARDRCRRRTCCARPGWPWPPASTRPS